ncbi:MAG TPA: APC family permease [Gemmatimonadaceae bacterium]
MSDLATPSDAPDVTTHSTSEHGRLLQALGVVFGLAVIVGNTIGMGILRTPGEIAARLPTTPLFLGAWIVGGLYALLGALALAELGTMIPKSGGQYVFVRRALGEYPGFVVGWSDWLSTCASTSAVAIVIGEYAPALFPALAGRASLTACAVVVAFSILQWQGVNWGDRTQQITSLLKALALVALTVACFAIPAPAQPSAEAVTASAGSAGLGFLAGVVVALQGVIYTYDGWNGVIYFSEEVRDPGRDIPRSMFGGVLLVTVIYLALNVAFLHVLPLSAMAGDKFVAGTAAAAIFGARGDTVIRSLMVLALLSSVNALQLMASRVPFAMSRDRLLPARVMRVNGGGTPTTALVLVTAVALAFILTGTFGQVLALTAFFFVLNYLLSFTSLFVLRHREPDTARPYRAWGYPWTTGIALVGSLAFLVGALFGDRVNSMRSLALLALSYPIYLMMKRVL